MKRGSKGKGSFENVLYERARDGAQKPQVLFGSRTAGIATTGCRDGVQQSID
jgi:hypothetical protein